jgi:hypothetical protein
MRGFSPYTKYPSSKSLLSLERERKLQIMCPKEYPKVVLQ